MIAKLKILAVVALLMAWCAEAAGRLPNGYTELTHVTLSGGYFNLGIPLLDSYRVETVFKLTKGTSLFGAREGASANNIECDFKDGGYIDFNNSDYSTTRLKLSRPISPDSIYYVSVSREEHVVRAESSTGNVLVQRVKHVGDSIRTPECYLFKINGNPYAVQADGSLYSFKITDIDAGTVIREFVPCRKLASGVVGLYDISSHSDDSYHEPFLEPVNGVATAGDRVTADDEYEVVAYWPLGSRGTVDASGHGNDLVAAGVSFDDGCAVFDGNQTQCKTVCPIDLRAYAEGLTVEMFVQMPQGAASSTQILIEQSEQFTQMDGTFMMDVGEYGPGVVAGALKTKGSYNVSYSEVAAVNDGAWHHLAMVFSSKMANVMELYVDGNLKSSKKLEGKIFPLLNNDWLFLGSRANSQHKFIGKIDDVKITAGILPVERFMCARSVAPGEVLAYWPFCRGTEKVDASGAGHPSDVALALEEASAVTVECFAKKNGAWHHFARVYGAGVASMPTAVYLDGEPYAGSDYDDVCVVANGSLTPQFAYSDVVDDVRVTAAALQTSDFLKTRTVSTPKTLHFWRFDHHGFLDDAMGRLPLESAGGVCLPYALDGAAKFPMSLGLWTANNLNLSAFKGFTVELMVKYPADAEAANVLELSPNMNVNSGSFSVSTDGTGNGHPAAIFRVNGSYAYNGWLSDGIVKGDDQWHHWAFTVDRSSGSIKTEFYIDGIRQTNNKNGAYAKTVDTAFYNGKLNFGFRSEGTGSYMYRGMLDDVKISAGILKPDELMTVADRSAEDPVTVAHWTFDGQDPLADVSGNGHGLTGTAEVSGGQAVFDGTQSLSTVEPLSLVGRHQVTVEAVFRLSDVNAEQVLFELGGDPAAASGRFTASYDGNGSVVAGVSGDMKRTACAAFGANGLWHHLALIVDLDENARGSVTHLFVDGREETPVVDAGARAAGGAFSVERIFLGARTGATSFFKGALREVRVSAGVCAPEEFLTLPGAGAWAGDEATVAYWPFNPGDALADATGNGFTLQTGKGASVAGACAEFRGTGSGIVTTRELPFAAMDKLTVEFFAKAQTPSTGGGLVASGTATGLACEFAVYEMADGVMQSRLQTGAYDTSAGIVGKPNVRASTSSLADGRWHHYALVIDRLVAGAGQCLFYVDGVEQPSKGSYAFGFGRPIADAILTIGANADGTGTFNGKIDDVRISAAALAPSQFLQKRTAAGLVVVIR